MLLVKFRVSYREGVKWLQGKLEKFRFITRSKFDPTNQSEFSIQEGKGNKKGQLPALRKLIMVEAYFTGTIFKSIPGVSVAT